MNAFTAPTNIDRPYQRMRLAQAVAYLLALLLHLAVWRIYQTMPNLPPEDIQPPSIEVSLVAASSPPTAQPAAAPLPTPPKPQAQPLPPPQPVVPKTQKPAPKKLEKPKPLPKPKPIPKPQAEAEPAPRPEPAAEEAAPSPAPPTKAETAPAPAAAPARAETARAGAKTLSGDAEDNHYSKGSVGGYPHRYPRRALDMGWEGITTVKIHVSADGEIENVTVASSSGHEVLDDAAIEMVRDARHVEPCRRGGKPESCTFNQPIKFTVPKE